MQLLLDTHTLLWAMQDSKSLSQKARKAISSEENAVFVSMATLWELSIKKSLKKIKLPKQFNQTVIEAGYELIPITPEHIDFLTTLPLHHRDPFDRLLIAQAKCEEMTLVSNDRLIVKYAVDLL